jgi:hypothetical protein
MLASAQVIAPHQKVCYNINTKLTLAVWDRCGKNELDKTSEVWRDAFSGSKIVPTSAFGVENVSKRPPRSGASTEMKRTQMS